MGEKRKRPSTAHARSQSTTKRLSITPAPAPPAVVTPPPPPEPAFPTSFDRDGPLPVLTECQPDDLPLKDFKSVAESKVLSESLLRSTRKWVDGDIFEKYWTKPLKSRKLDPAIIEKNPGKDTMVKLGNATMHCKPHKFDVRLYQVFRPLKEQPLPPPGPQTLPHPHQQPMMQHPQQQIPHHPPPHLQQPQMQIAPQQGPPMQMAPRPPMPNGPLIQPNGVAVMPQQLQQLQQLQQPNTVPAPGSIQAQAVPIQQAPLAPPNPALNGPVMIPRTEAIAVAPVNPPQQMPTAPMQPQVRPAPPHQVMQQPVQLPVQAPQSMQQAPPRPLQQPQSQPPLQPQPQPQPQLQPQQPPQPQPQPQLQPQQPPQSQIQPQPQQPLQPQPQIRPQVPPIQPAPQPAVNPPVQQAPPQPQQQPPQPQQAQPIQQRPPQPAATPQQPQAPRPDPVIQMLAMKAATDVKLKELMRIVASGKATREQLQEFQGYIDQLTAASNNAPPGGPLGGQPRPPAPPQQMQQPQPPRQQFPPQQPQYHSHGQPMQPQQMQMHPIQHQQMYQQHPQQQLQMRQYQQPPPPQPIQQRPGPAPKARAYPQPAKQELCGIVFEFIDSYSQGDRFHFPRHTILEYQNRGTTVIASFIVTRTPEGSAEEFYQPITIVLESAYPRILEQLKAVVADPETTRAHMKGIMDTKKRAGDTFLIYRLKREPGEAIPDKTYIETRMEPPPRAREHRPSIKDSSHTPARDSKSGMSTPSHGQQQSKSGPKVKHVKKHFHNHHNQYPTSSTSQSSIDGNNSQNHLNSEDFPDPAHSIDDLNPYDYDYNHEHDPKLPKPPRSRKGRIADPTKSCHLCQTSKTSLWRKADIEGENVTVCNACGIKWKTNAQKQVQIAAAVAQGLPIPVFADDVPRVAGAGAGMMQTMGSMGGVGGVGGVTMQSGWELGLQGLQGVESVTGQVFAVGGGGMVQIIPPGTQILPNGVPSRIIYQPASMPEQIPQQITPAPTQPPIVNQQIPPPDTQPLNPNAVPVTAPTAPLKTIEAPPMARLASLAPLYPSTQRGPVPPPPCQPGQPRLPPSEPVLSVSDIKPVETVAKPTEPKGPKDAVLVPVLPAKSSDSGVQVTEPAPAAEVLKD